MLTYELDKKASGWLFLLEFKEGWWRLWLLVEIDIKGFDFQLYQMAHT